MTGELGINIGYTEVPKHFQYHQLQRLSNYKMNVHAKMHTG
jgi:hypothetical protein